MKYSERPALANAKAYIYNTLDLTSIADKLVFEKVWQKSHAQQACQYYRNFLWLLRKEIDIHELPQLPPSMDMDIVWHEHILRTKQYHDDCTAIFGQYLHHKPTSRLTSGSKQSHLPTTSTFNDTQARHLKEFGEYIYEIRGWYSKLISWLIWLTRQRPFYGRSG